MLKKAFDIQYVKIYYYIIQNKGGIFLKTLLKGGTVVNVFTDELEKANVLIEDERIIGVGDYSEADADCVHDVSGKYICPGFIDGHIHIESTMMLPAEFARAAVLHGTSAVVSDPHEIANVCGSEGIEFMLEASEGLPLDMYIMVPSCVPATSFDESGAELSAADIEPFYRRSRVLGLAEMMNYVGVVSGDKGVMDKINSAKAKGKVINGHAPLLSGRDLDKYVAAGIRDDHECSSADEAKERIRKGQRVMIRNGTAARNLSGLIDLFDGPWNRRCLLVTDDKHAADLIANGHIDDIIRLAVKAGKSAVTGIRMATLQAAEAFGLKNEGAVAPGYSANLAVLDDLDSVSVCDVYHLGKKVVSAGKLEEFENPKISAALKERVLHSFNLSSLCEKDFHIAASGIRKCRVIDLVKHQLITEEALLDIDFSNNNGVDTEKDILKLAVIERHRNTGHIGLGFIRGIGLKEGAIAASVSHDSHNLIVIGTGEADMAFAANRVRGLGGGMVVVRKGSVVAEMPLPYAGIMTDSSAIDVAKQNEAVRESVHALGVPSDIEPFMTMTFVSLSVIPKIKMTTHGLFSSESWSIVPLFAD